MSATLHPRHEETTRAGLDIQTAVIAASTKYSLTFSELVNILAVVLTSWSKSAVIAERVVQAEAVSPRRSVTGVSL